MIPTYPKFTSLELEHKELVEEFTDCFEPYSDFNFLSLYCWDQGHATAVSCLNNNLVIKLPDYLTGDMVYSVLGNQDIFETLTKLLNEVASLKLVPEITVNSIRSHNHFAIKEDPDNFDYLFSLRELSELPKNIHGEKRKKANRFARNYRDKFQVFEGPFNDASTSRAISYILDWWSDTKGKSGEDTKQEREAINKLLGLHKNIGLVAHILTVDGVPVGFSVYEILKDGYALSHFHKTLPPYKNADVFFNRWSAGELVKNGCSTANWEQDLGIEGLRQSKMSYHPKGFLKKYTVTLDG